MAELMELKPAVKAFKLEKYNKASEVLTAARNILRRKGRWVQNTLAVSLEYDDKEFVSDTSEVDAKPFYTPQAKDQVAFCALGAVQFVDGPGEILASKYLRKAANKLVADSELEEGDIDKETYEGRLKQNGANDEIFEVNDDYGYEAVMKMFALAIRYAKEAEAKK